MSRTKKTQKLFSIFHSRYYAYNHKKSSHVGTDVVAHAYFWHVGGRGRQISVSSVQTVGSTY